MLLHDWNWEYNGRLPTQLSEGAHCISCENSRLSGYIHAESWRELCIYVAWNALWRTRSAKLASSYSKGGWPKHWQWHFHCCSNLRFSVSFSPCTVAKWGWYGRHISSIDCEGFGAPFKSLSSISFDRAVECMLNCELHRIELNAEFWNNHRGGKFKHFKSWIVLIEMINNFPSIIMTCI